VLALAVALSACGSSPNASTTTTTVPSSSSSISTTTTVATGPPGTAATCSTGVLSASASFGGGAAGTLYYAVSVKNIGPTACSLNGYPSYAFFGASGAGGAGAGARLAISQVDAGPPPSPVRVAPGSTAESIIIYTDVPTNGTACVQAASALLTPPGSQESISFPITFGPCGGSVKVYAFGPPGSERP
jgi:Protein of unknown function (DUF4232)